MEAFLTNVVAIVIVVVVAVVVDVVSESAKREMVFVLLSATLESRHQSRELRYLSTAEVVLKAGMVMIDADGTSDALSFCSDVACLVSPSQHVTIVIRPSIKPMMIRPS